MSPPDGPYRGPRSKPSTQLADPRKTASVDRAADLVDALVLRALRQERVLEVLDLRAARSARKLAERLQTMTSRWASAADPVARSEAAFELLELMEAAEIVLLVGEGPAPSTDRGHMPSSSVMPTNDLSSEVRPALKSDVRTPSDPGLEVSPDSDESCWQAMLGGPPSRPPRR